MIGFNPGNYGKKRKSHRSSKIGPRGRRRHKMKGRFNGKPDRHGGRSPESYDTYVYCRPSRKEWGKYNG